MYKQLTQIVELLKFMEGTHHRPEEVCAEHKRLLKPGKRILYNLRPLTREFSQNFQFR